MDYKTFINLTTALINYTDNHYSAFFDFGRCEKSKLICNNDIDYYKELKKIYLRSRNCKKNNKMYLNKNILACALIIIRYPNDTFENVKGDITKIKYLLATSSKVTLLEKAKILNKFMIEV